MKRLYLFALEIVPLDVGRIYDVLPSHLTLMSRFLSDLAPYKIASIVRPLFGETTKLGPKQVSAHILISDNEQHLHNDLRKLLDEANVDHQYPEFIGKRHRAHVTEREGVHFAQGSSRTVRTAYLIEVVDKKRIVCDKFQLRKV